MDNWKKKNWKDVKNDDLMKAIYYLRNELSNVTYCHIRGHSGIHGNEAADKMCNKELNKNL